MGIDDNYNGVPNEVDPSMGPGDKIRALMQALAALLTPQAAPADQASPAQIAGAGDNAQRDVLSALMAKLAGNQQAPVDTPPMPMADTEPDAGDPMEADEGEDQSAIENDMRGGKSFPEAHPDVPATKAKGAMAKLAKARGGK